MYFGGKKMKKIIGLIVVFVAAGLTQTADAGYVDTVNNLGPIAYWRLGELSGTTAYDSSSNNIHGTYKHGVTLGRQGALWPYDHDASVYVASNYVEIPHDNKFLLDRGTVQFWFKDLNSMRKTGLLSKDSGNYDTGGHLTFLTENNKVRTRLQSTTSSYYVESDRIYLDRWYYVAFTFGQQGMKLYLNGSLVDTHGYTGGLGTSSGGSGNHEPMVLGANTWTSGNLTVHQVTDHFSGQLDEVAIFDKPLCPDQISTLYELGTTGVPEPATLFLLGMSSLILVPRRNSRSRQS
jgi:hypothetical protein